MVPPLVGVAVKVNALSAQDGLVPVVRAIETDGTTLAVMLIVIAFDVAVVGLAQGALDVITQVTT